MAKMTDSKAKAKTKCPTTKRKTSSQTTDTSSASLRGTPGGPPRQPGVERRRNHPIRAKHGYIELILTQAMPQLGQAGDLVKVRPGFARNYLVPQGLATFATQNNLRMVEKHRQRLKELEEARRADLQNLGAQIAQRSIDDRSQRQRRGTPLRLGQRRSDCRRPANGRLPDRRGECPDRGSSQGTGALHDQDPLGPGHP